MPVPEEHCSETGTRIPSGGVPVWMQNATKQDKQDEE